MKKQAKIKKELLLDIGTTIRQLLEESAKVATRFCDKKTVIKASRRTFKGKFSKGNIEIVLTIGKPNYEARQFIKKYKRNESVSGITLFKHTK